MSRPTAQVLFVNSANRIAGTDSSFSYELPIDPFAGYDSVSLQQISIPKSFYSINESGDTFTLHETVGGVTRVVEVAITHGNYSRRSLAAHLGLLMTAASTAAGYAQVYSVSVLAAANGPDLNKFSFSYVGAAAVDIEFPNLQSPARQLGFDRDSTRMFVANTIISPNVINVQRETTIYIRSSICDNGSSSEAAQSVLAEVFADSTADFGSISYSCGSLGGPLAVRRIIRNSTSRIHTFSVTDEDGVAIPLNGQNVLFSLLLFNYATYRG